MAASTLTIRLDSELKKEASKVAEYYGLDLSSVTRAIYKQMVNTHSIPLTLSPEVPNEETVRALKEGEDMLSSGAGTGYTDARSLLEAALA